MQVRGNTIEQDSAQANMFEIVEIVEIIIIVNTETEKDMSVSAGT